MGIKVLEVANDQIARILRRANLLQLGGAPLPEDLKAISFHDRPGYVQICLWSKEWSEIPPGDEIPTTVFVIVER